MLTQRSCAFYCASIRPARASRPAARRAALAAPQRNPAGRTREEPSRAERSPPAPVGSLTRSNNMRINKRKGRLSLQARARKLCLQRALSIRHKISQLPAPLFLEFRSPSNVHFEKILHPKEWRAKAVERARGRERLRIERRAEQANASLLACNLCLCQPCSLSRRIANLETAAAAACLRALQWTGGPDQTRRNE